MKKQVHKSRSGESTPTEAYCIPDELPILFDFCLFSLLILRLGYLQIVKGEDYVRLLERTEEIPVNTSVPRGRIFDRKGSVLVDNDPKNAITYTKDDINIFKRDV